MASLKEVRIRIASVDSTKQITSAMKMVSASKLRRAQDRILGLRPYFNEMKILVEQILNDVPFEIESPLFEKRNNGRCLIIAMSSNRGLCGVFNANINKYINSFVENTEIKPYFENNKLDFFVFGKRVADFARKQKYNVIDKNETLIEHPNVSDIFELTGDILKLYEQGNWDAVYLIYNKFKNPAVQEVAYDKILPLDIPEVDKEHFYPKYDFIFQPNVSSIVDRLLIDYLKSSVYKAILETSAGEHGARMTAMHKATDNATELLKELKLTYNKVRQAAITKEIIEIVSGASALK